jgi:predicted nucleic acid-binding protein
MREILIDTSALIALFVHSEKYHRFRSVIDMQ